MTTMQQRRTTDAVRKDEPMTAARKAELLAMIGAMRHHVESFYWGCFKIGNHPFLEWNGLLSEYCNVCAAALKMGIDFTELNVHAGAVLDIADHQAAYLGEKFGCIFSPLFAQKPALLKIFLESAFGPDVLNDLGAP